MDSYLRPMELPKMNITDSPAFRAAQQLNREMETMNRELQKSAEEMHKKREEARQAVIQTAQNTSTIKEDLQTVIHNQNSYIKLLEQTIQNQEEQIANQEKQLSLLEDQKKNSDLLVALIKDILDFSEISTDIQNEIANMICAEIADDSPIRDYLLDKGGDITVAGIIAILPTIFDGVKKYILAHGLSFPI